MFIISAKFTKKKAVIGILILAVVLVAIILLVGNARRSDAASVFSVVVKNNADRVKFIQSLGWEIDEKPIEENSVVIPMQFGDVYADYIELQKSQGFRLDEYAGIEVKRYTYNITNYPTGDDSVVIDILVYRNRVIGGDVQSTSIDGFMHGLSYPDTENN